jgi:hypothetical protein
MTGEIEPELAFKEAIRSTNKKGPVVIMKLSV